MIARTATIALSALTLTLAPSFPAVAATGTFAYSFPASYGTGAGHLHHPRSGACIDISEIRYSDESAHTPRNDTDSTATLFMGPDCSGPYYSLRPGGRGSDRLFLRSVVFS